MSASEWPQGEALMVEYGGRWMTWDAFFWARLNALMPPQPKRVYAKRTP